MSSTRREFLVAACATSAGLLLGLPARSATRNPHALVDLLSAYVEIGRDGDVRIVSPQSEMGQGVFDSLARIVAEELEVDWERVRISLPDADMRFANPVNGRHLTGDSNSIRQYYDHLRRIGAAGRESFIAAAAARWKVDAAACRAELGAIVHDATLRRLPYERLIDEAALISPRVAPTLKPASAFRLIGKRAHRKDIPDKVTGRALFGTDVRLPGMLIACVRMPDALGSRITGFSDVAARALGGVERIARIEGAVAVLARTFWHAQRAARAIELEVVEADALDDARVETALTTAIAKGPALVAPRIDRRARPPKRTVPDAALIEREYARCERKLDVEYSTPYLTHLNMEPQVCTALVTAGRCEIWAPHQQPDRAREVAAQLTGLPLSAVTLHVTFLGTGFGRKWEMDTLRQCVLIANEVRGTPVKLMWSREQDTRHDFYRPATRVRTRVGLAEDGTPHAWISRIAGQSILAFQGRTLANGPDPLTTGELIGEDYGTPHALIEAAAVSLPVQVGFWRSVAHSHNAFYRESAMDEAAMLAGIDAYAYRRRLLAANARALAVLDAAARAIGWTEAASRTRGIAFGSSFGSYCAHAIEVRMQGETLRITRVVCAVDCGLVVDPDNVVAQIEGGTLFGLSAALMGGVSWEHGGVVQGNFNDQPVLRMSQAPRMEVIRIESNAEHGGIGEVAVPTAIAALANAVSAASGKRVRELPLARLGYSV